MEANFENRSALHGKIIEKYGSIQTFARAFGFSYTNMRNLVTGKTNWTLNNARKAVKLLGIEGNAKEIKRIFFSD